MAVKKMAKATDWSIGEYIGVQADVATLPITSAGSTFYAVDTSNGYISDGVAWFLL